jgi:hypothetical protein
VLNLPWKTSSTALMQPALGTIQNRLTAFKPFPVALFLHGF